MHGHVEAADLADDLPFADPAQLLVVPDHYVTRMLVSQGVPPEQLGVPRVDGGPTETDSRLIWQRFCSHWHLFRGTPSRYWLEHELVEVFGVTERPSAESADRIYDQIAATSPSPGSAGWPCSTGSASRCSRRPTRPRPTSPPRPARGDRPRAGG